jgi:hypothetical protein
MKDYIHMIIRGPIKEVDDTWTLECYVTDGTGDIWKEDVNYESWNDAAEDIVANFYGGTVFLDTDEEDWDEEMDYEL